jgi:hypothetical protein
MFQSFLLVNIASCLIILIVTTVFLVIVVVLSVRYRLSQLPQSRLYTS